jgi:hypothetical protein
MKVLYNKVILIDKSHTHDLHDLILQLLEIGVDI